MAKFTWGDQYRSHNNPYGWEEQENYNRIVDTPIDTPIDIIEGIKHPEDKAAARRLRMLYGNDFNDDMASYLAETPGRLSTIVSTGKHYTPEEKVKIQKALGELNAWQSENPTPGMDLTTANKRDLRKLSREFRAPTGVPRTADEMITQGLVREGIPQREIGRMVANTNMGGGTLTDIADASGGGIKKLAGYLRPSEHRLLETLSVDEPGVMNLLKLIGKIPK